MRSKIVVNRRRLCADAGEARHVLSACR